MMAPAKSLIRLAKANPDLTCADYRCSFNRGQPYSKIDGGEIVVVVTASASPSQCVMRHMRAFSEQLPTLATFPKNQMPVRSSPMPQTPWRR
jgi:hypothetical protein